MPRTAARRPQDRQAPTRRETRNAALYLRNPVLWPFHHLESDHVSSLLTVMAAAPALIRVKLCHPIRVSDEADLRPASPVTCNQRKPARFNCTNSETFLTTHGDYLSRHHSDQRFRCSVAGSGRLSPACHRPLYMLAGMKSC
jgi:hypothetical protein